MAAVQEIQRKHPQASITWVIGKIEFQLLEGLPGIEFVVYDKRGGKAALKAFKKRMRSRQFDALLIMQVALRANLLSRHIKATRRIGFDKTRSKELHSLFINERIPPQAEAHVLDGFMGFASALGVNVTEDWQPSWNIPITDNDQRYACDKIDDHSATLIIVPCASKAERNWLPDRYAMVADTAHQLGYQVMLCGGPSAMETDMAEQILQHSNTPITNLSGQTSLKQLYALIKRARMLIAPDTGPVHMAVSAHTQVIGLYGHSNPQRTGPYLYQEDVVEVYHSHLKLQTGKTAEQLTWGKRVKGEHVMKDISVERVTEKLKQLSTSLPDRTI